jgi:streptomycin 6-kinase
LSRRWQVVDACQVERLYHSDAHHDRTLDLITGWTLINDPTSIDHGDNPSDPQASNSTVKHS